MLLTILTPTFNRKKTLSRLWESLKLQSTKSFEWVIVDDGSSDGTRELVEEWSKQSEFNINYLYKINGGKHTALNYGLAHASGELTFIVDSDDWLTPDAVEVIAKTYMDYKGRTDICGYSFLRKYPNGKINGALFKAEPYIANYIEARVNRNDTHADKAEVYFTHILKEFPFPEYQGEKFLGEDLVWVRIARRYKMVHLNKSIYVGNYLDGGLTNNRRLNNIRSPLGCFERACEFTCSDIAIRQRIKGIVQLIVYGRFAGKTTKEIIERSHSALITIALLPVGFAVYRKWSAAYPINRTDY